MTCDDSSFDPGDANFEEELLDNMDDAILEHDDHYSYMIDEKKYEWKAFFEGKYAKVREYEKLFVKQ